MNQLRIPHIGDQLRITMARTRPRHLADTVRSYSSYVSFTTYLGRGKAPKTCPKVEWRQGEVSKKLGRLRM